MSSTDMTQKSADGGMDWDRFDAMTAEDIAAGVAKDPTAAPIHTPEQLASMRRISVAKHVRLLVPMTQSEFAAAYGIPLAKLQAWERHEAEPNEVELAYLRLIQRNPDAAKLVPA